MHYKRIVKWLGQILILAVLSASVVLAGPLLDLITTITTVGSTLGFNSLVQQEAAQERP